jgi:hypothetical protein
MLHQKETDRIRAYPTHQAFQTTGSTAQNGAGVRKGDKSRIGENSISPNKFGLAYLYL